MSADKLVRMANQIAGFFATQPGDAGAASVGGHINDNWAPPMRLELLDLIVRQDADLHPLVIAAASHIRKPKPAATSG
ncbi:formate dehydrogenase subunit delta [Phaeovulum sp.]|uniref:formate dehydrogenase subunit delta n=1 Tax=Phaeovulum sp. TaxID=2934796 RepID=UPI0039E270BC